MSKKGRKRQRQEREQLYRIHRECVRRNPEYKARYVSLANHPLGPEGARDLLAGEWRLDQPVDPDERPSLAAALAKPVPAGWPIETDSITDRRRQLAMSIVSSALKDVKADRASVAGTLTLAYIPDENGHRPRVTTLDIRWSKKDLMESLELWIDDYLSDRAAAGLKQDRPEKRLRLDHFSDYLRVYDLKEQGGMTFRQIGQLLWPARVGDVAKRARDYYEKGKALVLKPPLLSNRALDNRLQKPGRK